MGLIHLVFIILYTVIKNFFALITLGLVQRVVFSEQKMKEIDGVSKRVKVKDSLIALIYMGIFAYFFIQIAMPYYKITDRAFGFDEYLLKFFLVFLINDIEFYVFHRFVFHNKYLYKYIHAHHHRSNNPDLYTTFYISIPEMTIIGLFFLTIPLIMEVNYYMIIIGPLIMPLFQGYIHSDYNLFENNRFFIFPKYHRKHHQELRGNYGQIFQIWDKIFGTRIKKKD